MEDIYPGLTLGGFVVDGQATTRPKLVLRGAPVVGKIGVDVPQWLGGLWVANLRSFRHPDKAILQDDPQFKFRALTPKFFADAIRDQESFAFSLTEGEIGEAVHVSGAGARDYLGDVTQPITSVRANGALNEEGLALVLEGELGEGQLTVPEAARLMQSSYAIRLRVPWEMLRFIFYERRLWLVVRHSRLQKRAG